jgi:hypothetical protein
MTQHTPGPWDIKNAPFGALRGGPALLEHPGREAIEYARARGHDLLAQRDADLSLILAAPDMLAALQGLAWAVSGIEYVETEYAEQVAEARAAIAKALGEA